MLTSFACHLLGGGDPNHDTLGVTTLGNSGTGHPNRLIAWITSMHEKCASYRDANPPANDNAAVRLPKAMARATSRMQASRFSSDLLETLLTFEYNARYDGSIYGQMADYADETPILVERVIGGWNGRVVLPSLRGQGRYVNSNSEDISLSMVSGIARGVDATFFLGDTELPQTPDTLVALGLVNAAEAWCYTIATMPVDLFSFAIQAMSDALELRTDGRKGLVRAAQREANWRSSFTSYDADIRAIVDLLAYDNKAPIWDVALDARIQVAAKIRAINIELTTPDDLFEKVVGSMCTLTSYANPANLWDAIASAGTVLYDGVANRVKSPKEGHFMSMVGSDSQKKARTNGHGVDQVSIERELSTLTAHPGPCRGAHDARATISIPSGGVRYWTPWVGLAMASPPRAGDVQDQITGCCQDDAVTLLYTGIWNFAPFTIATRTLWPWGSRASVCNYGGRWIGKFSYGSGNPVGSLTPIAYTAAGASSGAMWGGQSDLAFIDELNAGSFSLFMDKMNSRAWEHTQGKTLPLRSYT